MQNPPPYGPYGYAPPPAGGFGAPPAGGYGAHYAAQAMAQQASPYAQSAAAVGSGWPALKWIALGSYVFAVLGGVIGGVAAGSPDEIGQAIGGILILLAVLSLLVALSIRLFWVYASWAMVAPGCRMTDTGRWISPGQAVGYLFIPFYNLYWMFVVHPGLSEALNRALYQQGSHQRASKGLALAACITSIIPYVNLLVSPIVWIVYMFSVDRAKAEYVRVSTAAQATY